MFDIPKMWNGGRCFIIGGGPSMLAGFGVPEGVVEQVYKGQLPPSVYSDYMSAIHSEHVIGINMAFRIGHWMDFVMFGDNTFRDQYLNELVLHPALKVAITPRREDLFKWVKRHRTLGTGLTMKPGELCWNMSTGAAGINLAVQLGCREIYLLGFDMKLNEGLHQHWHKVYGHKDLENIDRKVFSPQTAPFKNIARDAAALGVKIYNCSPDSKIECFPKMTIKEALEHCGEKPKPEVRKRKVSVLVTAYKAAETIEAALDSIYYQTYDGGIEVLLGIDGCQATREKVESIRHKYEGLQVFWSEENIGTYPLSNSLLDKATGESYLRFDSDDVMYPNMIEELINHHAPFIRCMFDWESWETGKLLPKNQYTCGALFGDIETVKEIGGYKPWICASDSDLLRRLGKQGTTVIHLPKRLYKRYRMPDSLTTNEDTCMGSPLRKKLHQQIVDDLKQGIVAINFETRPLCKL